MTDKIDTMDTTDKEDIPYPLGVTNEDEKIKAAINILLKTSPGEVPFRPNFGLGAERLLGGSMSNLDIAYEVAYQLSTYEPRIKVKRITPISRGTGNVEIEIIYQTLKNNTTQTIKI